MAINRARAILAGLKDRFEDEASKVELAYQMREETVSEDEIKSDAALLLVRVLLDTVSSLRDFTSVKVPQKLPTQNAPAMMTRQQSVYTTVDDSLKEYPGGLISNELLNGVQSEIGKLLILSVTRGWEGGSKSAPADDVVSTAYLSISEYILQNFPDMAVRKHKVSGKMLVHHVCYRASPPQAESLLATVLNCHMPGAATPDFSGATPMHWLMKNPSASVNMMHIILQANASALQATDSDGKTPLHWAVDTDHPHLGLIQAIVELRPDSVKRESFKGWLPIHDLVNRDSPNLDVLKLFLQIYAESASVQSREGWTPLHVHSDRDSPSIETLSILINASPSSLEVANAFGHLPLHRLVDQVNPSLTTLKLVLEAFPQACTFADRLGFLPLHVALNRPEAQPAVAQSILQIYPEAASHPSRQALLPLHILVGTNTTPSIAIAKQLLALYPQAVGVVVEATLAGEESAQPWTPLTRAVEKHFTELSTLFFETTRNYSDSQLKPVVVPSSTTAGRLERVPSTAAKLERIPSASRPVSNLNLRPLPAGSVPKMTPR